MWTATIKQKDFMEGALRTIVTYSDGTTRAFEQEYYITAAVQLDNFIRARLAQLADLDTFASDLPIGQYTPAIVTPEVDAVGDALMKLKRLQGLIELGVIESTDPSYATALEDAKTAVLSK